MYDSVNEVDVCITSETFICTSEMNEFKKKYKKIQCGKSESRVAQVIGYIYDKWVLL
jgi:hypothetical protein